MQIIERKMTGEKPFKPVLARVLRVQLETFGKDKWMVTLVPVEGGYRFHAHPSYEFRESRVIQAENSKKVRVFKTVEAALNLARSFGFLSVAIELEPAKLITKRYARTSKKPSSAGVGK